MIYQATHHINFAQGEMAMFSHLYRVDADQAGMPYWVAFASPSASPSSPALLIERVLMRPW